MEDMKWEIEPHKLSPCPGDYGEIIGNVNQMEYNGKEIPWIQDVHLLVGQLPTFEKEMKYAVFHDCVVKLDRNTCKSKLMPVYEVISKRRPIDTNGEGNESTYKEMEIFLMSCHLDARRTLACNVLKELGCDYVTMIRRLGPTMIGPPNGFIYEELAIVGQ
jgi:hypothetical protein